jgi:hypothetical protein
MIKIEVRVNDESINQCRDRVITWCVDNIGPAIPKGLHNQKRKKKWAVKTPFLVTSHRYVNLFVRSPADATLATLRWRS